MQDQSTECLFGASVSLEDRVAEIEREANEECEVCGTTSRPVEECENHGYSSWLCEPCARVEVPYLFSN